MTNIFIVIIVHPKYTIHISCHLDCCDTARVVSDDKKNSPIAKTYANALSTYKKTSTINGRNIYSTSNESETWEVRSVFNRGKGIYEWQVSPISTFNGIQ